MIYPSFVTAFRTLTIIPLPGRDTDNHADSLPFFPVVGVFIGALVFFCATGYTALFRSSPVPLLSGILCTALGVVLTGALHVDGVADVADGFGGGRTKKRILAIFKDSRIGTFGATAVVFDLITRIVLFSWIIDHHHVLFLFFSPVASRTVVAWSCVLLPNARDGGGTAGTFFGSAFPYGLLVTTAAVIITAVTVVGLPLGVILLAALVPSLLFLIYCISKIDGITGDCLGAVHEIYEGSFLFFCVLVSRFV